ncbi:autotransporter outer membrane beta-barrel domain-containing protein [Xenorhabdus koppenhoeferi]|uniref:Outer membrane lipase/esterase n=1 Tax=Xenorhabdus koppenhoeferi TaxID=351659 RepID=A0A1I7F7I3_9GAMM|nr:autotransporter domain-containing protein [Xenorhabdus koppenhoeferi]SFU32152.1 outer membrane lipase/esterase [Xenorhabdus koppenhoeferi]
MKKAFLFTPALLALSINAISTANAYDKVYVFGDSLSDGGNKGRFTTDGATSQLYNEYLAQRMTRSDLTPSGKGGTNYAEGGAAALAQYSQFGFSTQKQVNDYLSSRNNRANSNGVYIHWVGGNDLATALMAGAKKTAETKNPEKGKEVAYGIAQDSATAASDQINSLVKAGAGLIIAPTVPDVSTTPRLLETLLKTGLEGKKVPKSTIDNILKQVHQGLNKNEISNTQARDFALKKVFHDLAMKAEALLPGVSAKEIEKELTESYEKESQSASNLTDLYNDLVDKKISESGGNILRADINGLLKEAMEDSTRYGIDNTLGYACPYGMSAAECTDKKPGFTGDKEFLFSDNFHPTPLEHKIIGQYIDSIYNAPLQVMALNQVNRAPVKSALSSLDGHLQQLRNGGNGQGKFGVFGGYTGSQNKTFTLGGDYQLIDNLLLGAMYSNYKDERTPVANFSYEGRGHVFTAYALWNYYNNGWLSGDVHYSHTNYDSLTRSIQLGEYTRRETGSTTGKQRGARITAGWDIPVTNYLTTSPIVQYAWDKGDVDGYRESGNNSSSMHFGNQNYSSKVGTLGWRVDTKLGRFNPYASVQFNHQFDDTHYKLSGAINSSRTSFVQESGKQNTNWRQYTVGVNANLINNVRGFASVTRNDGNAQDPNYNFSLGINASF